MSKANDTEIRHDVRHARSAIRSLPPASASDGTAARIGRRAARTYALVVPNEPAPDRTRDQSDGARDQHDRSRDPHGRDSSRDAERDSDIRPPVRPAQQQMPALDPPTVPFAIGGMVIWAIIGLVLLLFHNTLSDHGHTDWLWICLAGFLLGFPGWLVMIRHDRHRAARRRARTDQESSSVG